MANGDIWGGNVTLHNTGMLHIRARGYNMWFKRSRLSLIFPIKGVIEINKEITILRSVTDVS